MDLAARGKQWGEESKANRSDCGSKLFLKEPIKHINSAALTSDWHLDFGLPSPPEL